VFRVVDAADENARSRSPANIHQPGFGELMPNTLATATVDRLVHHTHVLLIEGTDSYRLAHATAGRG
jgi:DNA replication protein DnaC